MRERVVTRLCSLATVVSLIESFGRFGDWIVMASGTAVAMVVISSGVALISDSLLR